MKRINRLIAKGLIDDRRRWNLYSLQLFSPITLKLAQSRAEEVLEHSRNSFFRDALKTEHEKMRRAACCLRGGKRNMKASKGHTAGPNRRSRAPQQCLKGSVVSRVGGLLGNRQHCGRQGTANASCREVRSIRNCQRGARRFFIQHEGIADPS